jgi:phosphinothricin acetyltransferase
VQTATTFETEAPDAEEFARRISQALERHCWLVAEDERGEVIGYAYAGRHRQRAAYEWSVEMAVYLSRGSHRRGTGRMLYEQLIGLLRKQGYLNAYAAITLPNSSSVGLHESLGFRPFAVFEQVGYKSGAWRDVGWWVLELGAHHADPERPRSLAEALSADELARLRL